MKKCVLLFLLVAPIWGFSQAVTPTLLGHWHDETIIPAFFANPYHDVWGITLHETEYGIITSTRGVHVFDLDHISDNFEPVASGEGTDQGNIISHRDAKTYQHYLYCVADEGQSALQIFDLSDLPNSIEMVYESDEFVRTAHNIWIDEANARLYLAGGNGFTLRVLSLENPEQPALLASFPNANLQIPYVHDLYVQDNIGFLSVAFEGLWVVDFNDPANVALVGTMTSYPQQGYNHSGWLSDDGNYFYLCDETHGMDVKIVDVQDFLEMRVVSTMDAQSAPTQIPHNVIPQDDLLYVSYYYDGLQVFDVSNPEFPRRVAAYDTYNGPDEDYFAGAWGVYVMPSGRSLISDMNSGFYVFDVIDLPPNTSLTPNSTAIDLCVNQSTTFSVLVGEDFSGPVSITTAGTDANLEVQLSSNSAQPGEVLEVSVTALAEGFGQMTLNADDGTTQSQISITSSITGLPPAATPQAPGDGAVNVLLSPFFFWTNGNSMLSKRLELSTLGGSDFESGVFYETSQVTNSHALPIELDENTTYYWRIVTNGECGDTFSAISSFTTRMVSSSYEVADQTIEVYPNPTSEKLFIAFENAPTQPVIIQWYNSAGVLVKEEQMSGLESVLELATETLPQGLYWLRLSGNGVIKAERIVIER
ncbi:MAG TPA: choice-of-anchor B family protein [Saprospiraceae bacterium]|nr:choice-of-anchor B family protein [Saprospiraceae bacterium]HMQ83083.1 choice-of-anchor B family protein [Saprospiraceae bacterium]